MGHRLIQRNGRGRFITLEGGEGTGKSTQIRHLLARLESVGVSAVHTREPGGSAGAERIRALILEAGQARFGPLTETLLFFAARNDHLDRLIRPALKAGTWVISDRFADSTRVYQGCMGSMDAGMLTDLETWVIGETKPDLTLILDLPAEIGIARAVARRGSVAADGFEAESLAFHRGLRNCFLDLATLEPHRCVLVDASGDESTVADRLWQVVSERLLKQEPESGHG